MTLIDAADRNLEAWKRRRHPEVIAGEPEPDMPMDPATARFLGSW